MDISDKGSLSRLFFFTYTSIITSCTALHRDFTPLFPVCLISSGILLHLASTGLDIQIQS
jgi:hypothetical protein